MSEFILLKKYPIVVFVILAYLPMVLLLLITLPPEIPFEVFLVIGSWAPNIAAIIVLGLILNEKGGIRRLFAGWGKWKFGFKWYLAAISPLAVAFLVAGIYLFSGGKRVPQEQPMTVSVLLISFLLCLITGAMGEELGWRGFMLPRLQARFNALVSGLIVGIVWAFWHLPLWYLPGMVWEALPFWAFALQAVTSSIVFTWVINNTGGSMVMATVIHLMMNFGLNVVMGLGLVPPSDFAVFSSGLFTIYAIVVTILAGPKNLSRHSERYTI